VSVIPAGLAEPTTATIARNRVSARRTSHIDMIFGAGVVADPLRLRGRARDLATDADGGAHVVAEAEVDAGLDSGRHLRSLVTQPSQPGVSDLSGLLVGPGFRAALQERVGQDGANRSPLYLLLDDLPVAALISGYAFLYQSGHDAAARTPGAPASHPGDTGNPGDTGARMLKADICSGWRSDGTMMVALRSGGGMPAPVGPPAPSLVDVDDPVGWHDIAALPPAAMRRRRLVDVTWGDPLAVYAMFRDTHKGSDGAETVLHEYSVEATVDPATLRVVYCRATPRSLPWIECPNAADSAARLEGQPVAALRSFVRAELTGISTCTHLNDLLRSLADVAALAAILAERQPG
jgi:hypothetical protein